MRARGCETKIPIRNILETESVGDLVEFFRFSWDKALSSIFLLWFVSQIRETCTLDDFLQLLQVERDFNTVSEIEINGTENG